MSQSTHLHHFVQDWFAIFRSVSPFLVYVAVNHRIRPAGETRSQKKDHGQADTQIVDPIQFAYFIKKCPSFPEAIRVVDMSYFSS